MNRYLGSTNFFYFFVMFGFLKQMRWQKPLASYHHHHFEIRKYDIWPTLRPIFDGLEYVRMNIKFLLYCFVERLSFGFMFLSSNCPQEQHSSSCIGFLGQINTYGWFYCFVWYNEAKSNCFSSNSISLVGV
jgi:hypothetical protein